MTTRTANHRVFNVPNLAFIAISFALFIAAFPFLDSTPAILLGAVAAGGIGGVTWWLLTGRGTSDTELRGAVLRIGLGAAILIVATIAVSGVQVLNAWNGIDRQDFLLSEAQTKLTGTTPIDPLASTTTFEGATTSLPPASNEAFQTVLLIGSDNRTGNGDVILYLVNPTNGAEPFMMSFPRDLYVENPCTGGRGRINVLARGCASKDINGGTLMSVKVSQMTGIDVDHFALFDFNGFEDIIDAVGGVELCFENAVRDLNSELDLPAGCTNANGEQALSWVRSRHTQENRDGGWYRLPGAGDLLRNQHQQELILTLVSKLKSFDSPQQLSNVVTSVSDAFTLSNTITLPEALSLAWSFRDVDLDTIQRLEIPVHLTRSPTEQSILVADLTPREVIEAHYGGSLPVEGSTP